MIRSKFFFIREGLKLSENMNCQNSLFSDNDNVIVVHSEDEGAIVPVQPATSANEVLVVSDLDDTVVWEPRGSRLFPRTIEQANKLGEAQTVDSVMDLAVPHDIIIDRVKNRWIHLSSGRVYNIGFNSPKVPFRDDETSEVLVQRDDDKPETVKKRLQIYENFTKPLVDYYRKQGKLIQFHGKTSDEISPNVVKYLEERV